MNINTSWKCDSTNKERVMVSKVRIFLAALCAAWTQHLLERAIADLATRSEWDCRAVGLDRAEILAGLTQLHGATRRERSVVRWPKHLPSQAV